MKTNLGKIFFKLLKSNKMSRNFNKNTVKLSYNCCRNISSKISSNNYGCNCRNKSDFPLGNKCLTPSIVYKAIVSVTSKPDKNTSESTIQYRGSSTFLSLLTHPWVFLGLRVLADFSTKLYMKICYIFLCQNFFKHFQIHIIHKKN